MAIVCTISWRTALVFCCLPLFAFVSSCGLISDASEDPSAPRASGVTTQDNLDPISLPPGTGDRPLLPGQSGTQYMPNGLPALAPARGVNADTMFAEKIKDEAARFKRLENAVADMRREFEAIKPAIVRLSAVEGDMQDLIGQLQSLTGTATTQIQSDNSYSVQDIPATTPLSVEDTNAITQPVAPVAVAIPAVSSPPAATLQPEPAAPAAAVPPVVPNAVIPPVTASSPPVKSPSSSSSEPAVVPDSPPMISAPAVSAPVKDVATTSDPPDVLATGPAVSVIRSGEFEGMARLVLEVSGTGAYTLDIDSVENVLTIALAEADWRAPPQGTFTKPALLGSWSANSNAPAPGSVVLVQLKAPSVVAKQSVLPGANGQGKRIVIDIRPQP
jgi:hypothetical protein